MWLKDIIRSRRWFLMSLSAAIAIPGIVVLTLSQLALDLSDDEALEIAAVAVKNYIDENPPRKGWRATNIYIDPEQNIVIDVHVSRHDHAKVIKARNPRIQYSYLKLACPPTDAWVHDWLEGRDRIWINLQHHGTTIIKAPCPSNQNKGFLS